MSEVKYFDCVWLIIIAILFLLLWSDYHKKGLEANSLPLS